MSCDPWNGYASWNQSTKDTLNQLGAVTMDVLGNWFFWTWKVGLSLATGQIKAPFWPYQLTIEKSPIREPLRLHAPAWARPVTRSPVLYNPTNSALEVHSVFHPSPPTRGLPIASVDTTHPLLLRLCRHIRPTEQYPLYLSLRLRRVVLRPPTLRMLATVGIIPPTRPSWPFRSAAVPILTRGMLSTPQFQRAPRQMA